MNTHSPPSGDPSQPGAWRLFTSPTTPAEPDGQPEVAILRWPRDSDLRQRVAALNQPRLLLIDPGSDPPVITDIREDWIRLPAENRDIEARVISLRSRVNHHEVPVFDGMCRLGFRDGWAPLSPIEYRLASALVEHLAHLVSDKELGARAWGESSPSPNALRVHLARLRRRLAPLGLEILTVRSHGHVMQETGTVRPGRGSWPARS